MYTNTHSHTHTHIHTHTHTHKQTHAHDCYMGLISPHSFGTGVHGTATGEGSREKACVWGGDQAAFHCHPGTSPLSRRQRNWQCQQQVVVVGIVIAAGAGVSSAGDDEQARSRVSKER